MKLENLEFVKASPDSRGDDPTKGLLAANMPLLLNTAWSLSAMDIEASVSSAKHLQPIPSVPFRRPFSVADVVILLQASRAAKYVTRDVGVPWQTRFNRARALLLLGKVCFRAKSMPPVHSLTAYSLGARFADFHGGGRRALQLHVGCRRGAGRRFRHEKGGVRMCMCRVMCVAGWVSRDLRCAGGAGVGEQREGEEVK